MDEIFPAVLAALSFFAGSTLTYREYKQAKTLANLMNQKLGHTPVTSYAQIYVWAIVTIVFVVLTIIISGGLASYIFVQM